MHFLLFQIRIEYSFLHLLFNNKKEERVNLLNKKKEEKIEFVPK